MCNPFLIQTTPDKSENLLQFPITGLPRRKSDPFTNGPLHGGQVKPLILVGRAYDGAGSREIEHFTNLAAI